MTKQGGEQTTGWFRENTWEIECKWGRIQQAGLGSKEERREEEISNVLEEIIEGRLEGGFTDEMWIFFYREINVFGKGTINQPHHS